MGASLLRQKECFTSEGYVVVFAQGEKCFVVNLILRTVECRDLGMLLFYLSKLYELIQGPEMLNGGIQYQ